MRTTLNHSCEICGAIRQVSPDKLRKGLQKVCRKCNGPAAAAKRREAMLQRGGVKHVTYCICKECRKDYQEEPMGDRGFCSSECENFASQRGYTIGDLSKAILQGFKSPNIPQLSA